MMSRDVFHMSASVCACVRVCMHLSKINPDSNIPDSSLYSRKNSYAFKAPSISIAVLALNKKGIFPPQKKLKGFVFPLTRLAVEISMGMSR